MTTKFFKFNILTNTILSFIFAQFWIFIFGFNLDIFHHLFQSDALNLLYPFIMLAGAFVGFLAYKSHGKKQLYLTFIQMLIYFFACKLIWINVFGQYEFLYFIGWTFIFLHLFCVFNLYESRLIKRKQIKYKLPQLIRFPNKSELNKLNWNKLSSKKNEVIDIDLYGFFMMAKINLGSLIFILIVSVIITVMIEKIFGLFVFIVTTIYWLYFSFSNRNFAICRVSICKTNENIIVEDFDGNHVVIDDIKFVNNISKIDRYILLRYKNRYIGLVYSNDYSNPII